MKITIVALGALVACTMAHSHAAEQPKDFRVELPRDVRIVLLGVPSVANVKAAEEGLRKAIEQYEDDLAKSPENKSKLEQGKVRICFKLGQLDESIAALVRSMRDQERVKGQEAYRDLARELQLRAEPLAGLCGASATPVVQEDDEPTRPDIGASSPQEFVKQLKTELARIDEVLDRIGQQARPDEVRKAQLEKDLGAIGQFAFQIKTLAEDVKAAETEPRRIDIDVNEMARGVQGIIEVIRDLKREKDGRVSTEQKELRGPTPPKRHRL